MQVKGYKILDKIGEGRMTVIWRAYHEVLDRTVAIKALKPEFAANPEEVDIFIREARIAAEVQHPNAVQVYNVGEGDGTHYFIMEYVAGKTVEEMLDAGGPMDQKEALDIAACVAGALGTAWQKASIVHRNVKPANISIGKDGTVKLKYVGLSLRAGPAQTVNSRRIEGTAYYMPPEQARGDVLDCRADMYALGSTLYHMVSGQMPFGSADPIEAIQCQIDAQVPNPRSLVPNLSHGTVFLISKLMMKDPGDRYTDWDQVLHAIKSVASGRIVVGKSRTGAVSTVAENGAESPARKVIVAPKRTTKRTLRGAVQPALKRAPTRTPQPALQSGSPRTPQVDRIREKYSHRPSTPVWFRVAMWILLLTWWASFAYRMYGIPEQVATRSIPRRQAPAPRGAKARPVPNPVPTGVSAADRTALRQTCTAIAQTLVTGDFEAAQRHLDTAYAAASTPLRAELTSLREITAALPGMNDASAAALSAKVGSRMKIRIGDAERVIIPRSVVNMEIRADLVKDVGGVSKLQPVTFSIMEINPADRAEWLGDADSPATATMKCLLYAMANDRGSAQRLAAETGPLAEALSEALKSR